ncbi:hypothetical protein O181_016806 [Austropuccinia psidii MF-1]|uniref:ATP synthase F0 subunit 8 n=1 Tax=Austropuccinia psidii MF-1 TaxID=1389203 RepID=A0A9Q3C2E9_9BASI|nr:hypothetical protein [Austropuccinia psidii MF-1]
MFLVWNIWLMWFLLKASRWTKKKSSKFSIGNLQETSRLSNPSLALPTFTAVSSRIIPRKSVHLPVPQERLLFSPNEEALSHFKQLKKAFTTAPNLLYPPF